MWYGVSRPMRYPVINRQQEIEAIPVHYGQWVKQYQSMAYQYDGVISSCLMICGMNEKLSIVPHCGSNNEFGGKKIMELSKVQQEAVDFTKDVAVMCYCFCW